MIKYTFSKTETWYPQFFEAIWTNGTVCGHNVVVLTLIPSTQDETKHSERFAPRSSNHLIWIHFPIFWHASHSENNVGYSPPLIQKSPNWGTIIEMILQVIHYRTWEKLGIFLDSLRNYLIFSESNNFYHPHCRFARVWQFVCMHQAVFFEVGWLWCTLQCPACSWCLIFKSCWVVFFSPFIWTCNRTFNSPWHCLVFHGGKEFHIYPRR